MNHLERELKLSPLDPDLPARLASLERLGELLVRRRRRELQHNSFFDTASRALGRARVGFRRRIVAGQRLATWTVKADGQRRRGVAIRTEIELQLDPEMPPALAFAALRQAARQRGAPVLAETLADAQTGGLPLARPIVETDTDRLILDLESRARNWNIELAIDHVSMPGHEYREVEIEAELKDGDDTAFDAVRAVIEEFGSVRDSEGSKLSRALDHLGRCQCTTARGGSTA
jgi:inorganic triphosphatase YgiF